MVRGGENAVNRDEVRRGTRTPPAWSRKPYALRIPPSRAVRSAPAALPSGSESAGSGCPASRSCSAGWRRARMPGGRRAPRPRILLDALSRGVAARAARRGGIEAGLRGLPSLVVGLGSGAGLAGDRDPGGPRAPRLPQGLPGPGERRGGPRGDRRLRPPGAGPDRPPDRAGPRFNRALGLRAGQDEGLDGCGRWAGSREQEHDAGSGRARRSRGSCPRRRSRR